MYSPLPRLLVDIGLTGASWRAVLWLIDMPINIVLALPAAFLLTRLHPRNLSLCAAAAVLPIFVWRSRLIFFDEIDPRVSLTVFQPGWAMELLMLPLAIVLLAMLRRSRGA